MYCVYLTVYSGNKLPPFYIGYSRSSNILSKNYHGTVTSREYKEIWNDELISNPHLFKSKIIKDGFDTQKCAQECEIKLQKYFDVIRNPMYINKGIGGRGFSTKDQRAITDGALLKYINKKEPIPEGFRYGIPKDTEERSKRTKGKKKPFSEEGLKSFREKRSGDNNSSKRPEVKKKISDAITGIKMIDRFDNKQDYDEFIKKKSDWMTENNPFRGKTHTEETNLINSIKHKGKVVAKNLEGVAFQVDIEEFNSRADLVGANIGKVPIHNNIIEKKINKYSEVPEGWILGRLPLYIEKSNITRKENDKTRIKKIWITDDIISTKMNYNLELPQGWRYGRHYRKLGPRKLNK